MAGALIPSLPRFSTRRSAPRLVRTKSSDFSWFRQMAAATLTLSIWCTWRNRCSMRVTVCVVEATSWKTGSVRYRVDQAVDGTVERGGEQQRLVGLVEAAQHPLDLGHEPHVGHAVGLVEHQRLELVDGDLAPVAEVDEAARGGDDQVDPLAELGDLAVDVGTAVDGDGVQPELLRQRGQHVVHLHGELAGGEQDEGERPGRAGGGAGTLRLPGRLGPLQERHAEGEGLAGAGLGLAAHVASGQGVGDGQGLNGKRADDAFIGQRVGQFG